MPIPVDYSDGDIELYPFFEDEYDEWGNPVEWIDGFQCVDIDRVIDAERRFERRLRAINNGYIKVKLADSDEIELQRKRMAESNSQNPEVVTKTRKVCE